MIFSVFKRQRHTPIPAIFLTNSLTGKKERFIPIKPGYVALYSCGPTVYDRSHVGNLRPHVFADTLDRVFTYSGYHVRRVINITDVGHLVSDGDEGEDKIEVGARREKQSPRVISDKYTSLFLHDIEALNIDTEYIFFHAPASMLTSK